MRNTTITTGFTDPDTLQLRFELGTITDAVATDRIPAFDSLDQGWIWRDGWVGRVQLSGETFMPLDVYNASVLDPLFDAPGGETVDRMATIDTIGMWSVSVNGVGVGVGGLSRKANILDTATVGWGEFEFRTVQNVFLDLEVPLTAGDRIEIAFADARFDPVTVTYAPAEVLSEAIHITLTGYDPQDSRKVAYLSSWNGWSPQEQATVAQVYGGPLGFRVVDAATGAVALTGQTTLGTPAGQATDLERSFSLNDVWEMDLSGVTTAGRYYIEVDGVGRSNDFDVADDVWSDVFATSFSGFYHQRSGIALEAEYTDWTRDRSLHPDDGNVVVYATTLAITDTNEGYDGSKPDQFGPLVAAATEEILPDAWGGWHDAGDWDRRTQHLEAARKLIDLVEIETDWAESVEAQIPENTNGLPDLLDEALWGLDFFARLQGADGGVRGGIEGDDYRGYGANSAEEVHPLYAYAPDTWTSWEFAASAAKMSRVIAQYDADAAALWLGRAERAMDWAEARVPADMDPDQTTSRNLAAVELYATTGDDKWHDLFLQTSSFRTADARLDWNEYQYEATIAYSRLDPALTDDTVADRAFVALRSQADFLLDQGSTGAFGMLADPYAPYGWGNTASQPANASDFMVALHHLTSEQRYLDAILGDVQYGLGANPMNMAFLTGLDGVRSPEIVLSADADSMGGTPPPGITLYGDYNVYDYGFYAGYETMWDDLFPNPYESPVHESFQGYYLFVPSAEYTVQQGIADMTYVTGYLAAQAGPVGPTMVDPPTQTPVDETPGNARDRQVGTPGSDTMTGTRTGDDMRGRGGDDNLDGRGGNDILHGGTGADWLFGGGGDDTLRGSRNDDGMAGGAGNDTVIGGDGDDTGWAGTGDDVLRGQAGKDVLYGEDGDDRITGGGGNDMLDGANGDDLLAGGKGRDTLSGGADKDRLNGGQGSDTLDGQWGADKLTGGAGRDVFVFGQWYGTDTVRDFVIGEDLIDLSGLSLDVGFAPVAVPGSGGAAAVLTFSDQGTLVRLLGVDAAALSAEDFIL